MSKILKTVNKDIILMKRERICEELANLSKKLSPNMLDKITDIVSLEIELFKINNNLNIKK